jgi:hypothetical protein
VALDKISLAESATANHDAALTASRESLAICRQLHAAMGDLPQALNDLAYSERRVSEAERAAGEQ